MTTWKRTRGRTSTRWQLTVGNEEIVISTSSRRLVLTGEEIVAVQVRTGVFSATIEVDGPTPLRLRRLSKQQAPAVRTAVQHAHSRHRARPAAAAAVDWQALVRGTAESAKTRSRWITEETRDALRAARPSSDMGKVLAAVRDDLHDLFGGEVVDAVQFLLDVDLERWLDACNEDILVAETNEHRAFFDAVESRPLTDEQIRAVVAFDNRVQVVAAAGSGKTSVMIARAAYAVMRGFVPPDRILLLAFNKAAAVELQERVERGLARAGLEAAGVEATTFHAFGLSVLGRARQRKPRAAGWLDAGQDVEVLCRIVDELRDSSPGFAYRWDLFRLLYARAGETIDGGAPDGWDAKTSSPAFRTARGEVVKSEGERLIADFLHYNGVGYTYERPYSLDVADAEHSQYRPDFHYLVEGRDIWHEHWALDAGGRPPASFKGYLESMKWKRDLHKSHGTTLLETTWAQVMRPDGLTAFASQLRRAGLTLDWNPDRASSGSKPLKHEDLARLVRSFMSHVKSGSLGRDDLERRLAERGTSAGEGRARLFLDLYWPIADAWDAKLREEDSVDFEDMLVAAAEHLEKGGDTGGWELVLVDELQDASRARARLARALVAAPGRHLLAVGDDWQSINRFAGADITVMTGFADWFGAGPELRLQTTFRCPQELCDSSSAFVSKNPRQLAKSVRSAQADPGVRIRLVVAASFEQLKAELATTLADLAREVGEPGPGRPTATVDVLGRYRFEGQLLPRSQPPGLRVRFRTVHSSKGLESDYVILPNMTVGTYGFPSSIEDDPVLSLAMAEADDYPNAEERRLFYVALTRARRHVTMLTVQGRESPFVVELLQDGRVDVVRAPGPPSEPCPTCGQGTLVTRSGKYGPFSGCSRFPRCRHTTSAPPAQPASSPSRGRARSNPPF
ncbi:MAG: UvrD-helicase domain-containing protein [Actinomycetes bacterium]